MNTNKIGIAVWNRQQYETFSTCPGSVPPWGIHARATALGSRDACLQDPPPLTGFVQAATPPWSVPQEGGASTRAAIPAPEYTCMLRLESACRFAGDVNEMCSRGAQRRRRRAEVAANTTEEGESCRWQSKLELEEVKRSCSIQIFFPSDHLWLVARDHHCEYDYHHLWICLHNGPKSLSNNYIYSFSPLQHTDRQKSDWIYTTQGDPCASRRLWCSLRISDGFAWVTCKAMPSYDFVELGRLIGASVILTGW